MKLALLLALCVATNSCFAITLGAAKDAPFEISVKASLRAVAQAQDSSQAREAIIGKGESRAISVSSDGQETSQCSSTGSGYGRRSRSESATATRIEESYGTLEIRAELKAISQGGHFRRCVTCMGTICVGISGTDTGAHSEAATDIMLDVAFLKDFSGNSYQLVVKHEVNGNGIGRHVTLSNGASDWREVPNGEPVTIAGGPGGSLRVSIGLSLSSDDIGGCCRNEKGGSFKATVSLLPAPSISASVFRPAGSILPKRSHNPAVGLLVSRGSRGEPVPFCTGTVIGHRTILTAAHCLEYLPENAKILFAPGLDLASGIKVAIPVDESVRPTDKFPGGFRFRFEEGRFVDDIALLYTREPLDVNPARLARYSKPPNTLPMAQVVTFLTIEERETKFIGADATQVTWDARLEPRDARSYFARSQDGTVCAGTSGAPVMLPDDSTYIVAMVVSGEGDCTATHALKMDAYWPWLAKRIR